MAPDERVRLLGELERADEAIGVELAELDELHAAVEDVRRRAAGLLELLERLPGEQEAARAGLAEAEEALAEAREAAEQARQELEAADGKGDDERLAAARRFDLRARDHLHVVGLRAAAAGEHAAELEARAGAASGEGAELESHARELAEALASTPRLAAEAVADPGEGPQGAAEWGTRARAALLVARGQVAAERDAVVRQAAELGALLLGEALPATSAAGVARRVERELGAG
jgi:hypothetical protein